MPHRFKLGQWLIRPDLQEIDNGSEIYYLEPKLMKLLLCLVQHQDEPLSREFLLDQVWQGSIVSDEVLTTAIYQLRRLLDDNPKQPMVIQTLPKVGYRLIAPVHAIFSSSPDPQPKWHTENGSIEPKPDYPIWPMALITAIGLTLGLIWFSGGFDLNQIQIASAIPQPMTSLPGRETDAAISPDGRSLVFSWAPSEKSDINLFLKDLPTGVIQQLTENVGTDHSPAWSPDGQRLAFIRESDNRTSLFLLDLGPNRELLLHPLAAHYSNGLSWSPDGQLLAFSDRQEGISQSAIMVVALASGEVRQVSRPPSHYYGDYFPRFSPNGREIAFIRKVSAGIGHLYTSDLEGKTTTKIAALNGALRGVEWLTDRKLLFASDHQGPSALMWVDIKDKLPNHFPGIAYNAARPTLSPGGQYLTFETVHEKADILTFSIEEQTWPNLSRLRTIINSSRWDSTPEFSPDGAQIAFSSTRSGRSQIWISDRFGGNPRQLTHLSSGFTSAPRWSPDGNTIAFDARPEPNSKVQIFTVPVNGGPMEKISDSSADDLLPVWSACGSFIYFNSNRQHQRQLWRMPAKGGLAQQVTKSPSMIGYEGPNGDTFYYVKHADGNRIWRIDLTNGKETRAFNEAIPQWGNWVLTANGIYFIKPLNNGRSSLQFLSWDATASKTIRVIPFTPENLGFALSQKDQIVAIVQKQPPEGDIMLLPLH